MAMRLHWSPDSANLPVRIAMEMYGLPFEAVRVDRAAQEHRSAAYLEKNPQGLIPVLEDDGLVLFETGAILWYLAEKVGRLGPSAAAFADIQARTSMLKWMFFLSNTVHADLRIGFNPRRYIDAETESAMLNRGVSDRMRGHFDVIEGELAARLSEGPLVLTDIYFAALVRWAQLYPLDDPIISGLDRWPGVHAICSKVEEDAGARRAFDAEFIPSDQAITSPRLPDLPLDAITGV